jgi:hypothetical protein
LFVWLVLFFNHEGCCAKPAPRERRDLNSKKWRPNKKEGSVQMRFFFSSTRNRPQTRWAVFWTFLCPFSSTRRRRTAPCPRSAETADLQGKSFKKNKKQNKKTANTPQKTHLSPHRSDWRW